eukprot:TRINITY_DN2348_c0_g1_i6.p1 TRINITY_DN2348_c0_g1~~TRINITY_DN2348_c0_g1_i6.p1  ORF type:complete len:101 (+),score=20.01 TRINITY_DN2348_c0_g1_i6:481-783(+)
MAFPALAIHTQVKVFGDLFKKMGRFQRWGPTVSGLALLPALPYLFDHPVEYVVNKTFDTVWPTKHHHNPGVHVDDETTTTPTTPAAPATTTTTDKHQKKD